MDHNSDVENRIVVLTNKLRIEKPTVYKHLIETPQTLPKKENDEENFDKKLKEYEEHLKNLLSS